MSDKSSPKTAGQSSNSFNKLKALAALKTAGPKQASLDLQIRAQAEVDGLEIGILSDGTPFLTGRGLALLCGVNRSVIQDMTADWGDLVQKPRITAIKELLGSRGLAFEKPYVATIQKGNATSYAYPDAICLAVLEYFAFDNGGKSSDVAIKNFRALAGHALREFIYSKLKYDPNANVPQVWKKFHDRVSLVYAAVPSGYFGIFREISDMILTLGQAGLHIDDGFVPDISVGIHWGKHWDSHAMDSEYGDRIKFDHNYPDYFPQALSNPQDSWCYPEMALGEFRRWFREEYIGGGKFADYLLQKVQHKALDAGFASLAIAAYEDEGI